jgi:hypothetical protein
MIKVLIVGDIIGRPGRKAIEQGLSEIRNRYNPEIILISGDNLAGGFGITKKIYHQMVDSFGVDAITVGNHWQDKSAEAYEILKGPNCLILPSNMDKVDVDAGLKILKSKDGHSVCYDACGWQGVYARVSQRSFCCGRSFVCSHSF